MKEKHLQQVVRDPVTTSPLQTVSAQLGETPAHSGNIDIKGAVSRPRMYFWLVARGLYLRNYC